MIDVTLRKALLGLVAAAALAFTGLAAQAEESGKPMIVKIHADWCGTCTRLNPTFEVLQKEVGSEAMIVVLDVTDRQAVDRSRAEAEKLGIVAFFDEYKGKTGTVGVLDASGRPVEVMKGVTDPARYVAALKRAEEA